MFLDFGLGCHEPLEKGLITPDVSGKLSCWKPHRGVCNEELQGRVQGFHRNEIVTVKLIDNPQQTMHLDLSICCEGAKTPVTGQKNAAGMPFSKRKRKAIMDGELRKLSNSLLGTKNAVAGQVNDF